MAFPRTLSLALDKIARDAVGKDWALYASLIEHWREIVGEEYAKSTSPVKITFPKGKKDGDKWAGQRAEGTLHIRLPQGLAMSFGFLNETVRSRINAFFGYTAVSRIVLETYYPTSRPLPAQEPAVLSESDKALLSESLKDVENEELREILHQLGESVIREGEKE